jgi:transcriptional regulator with XRE-family HTH domain
VNWRTLALQAKRDLEGGLRLVSGNGSARLPDDAWRDQHMIRAWRTRDFRAVFHLACRYGLKPEGIADATGLPVDQVLSVMRGNEALDFAEQAESVARGLEMPGAARKAAGVPLAGIIQPVSDPAMIAAKPLHAARADHPGIRIAELRNERSWSQEFLAERAGVSVPTINKLERQERNPSLEMMRKISGALGVAVAEIVDPLSLEKSGRKREPLPDHIPDELLAQPDFIAACHARDLGNIFSAAMKSGFTASHLARRCEMTVGQVTAYVRHGRQASEIAVLDRVSDGLRISSALLGIGPRTWETTNSSINSIVMISEPGDATRSEPTDIADPLRTSFPADMVESMKRREFLLGMAATTAGFGAVGAMTAREAIRHETVMSLGSRAGTTDVDEWREIAAEYGESYPATEPGVLLQSLMVDLYGLQAAMQANTGDTDQCALRGVGAMLTAFTAQTIANLGNLRESRRWWRTARNAADDSQDPYTVLWVRGREIVRAGYEQRPLSSILQLIDELEARITNGAPTSGMPEFLSGKAQTLALLGPSASDEAEQTLNRLRASSDALPTRTRAGTSIHSWGEERLRFTESLTYTYLGNYRKADQAQTAALALYPADDLRSPAQIELQRAMCLIGSGDTLTGVRHAQDVIAGLPVMHRIRPVADLGNKVLRAIPAQRRNDSTVNDYRDCLTATFEVVPEITA